MTSDPKREHCTTYKANNFFFYTAAKSRDDVTELFGTESDLTDRVYTMVLAPVKAVGSVPKVLEVGDTILELMKWANRNVFPMLPLK